MSVAAAPQSPQGPPLPPRRPRTHHLDGVMSALAMWCLSGGFLDAWAHTHGVAESFFTPWHALFYSGVLAVCTVLGVTIGHNRRRGASWRAAVPGGYDGAVLGIGLMAVGGVGDLLWHTAFGIEAKVAAALSPPHLLLACGLGGVVSAPLRAAWQRLPGDTGWPALLPMVVSTAGTLSLLTLMTAFASPLVAPWAVASPDSVPTGRVRQVVEALGVSTVLLHTGWVMGLLLLICQRWRLPWGSLTLVLTANALAMSLLDAQYRLIPAAGLAGLLADLLYGRVRLTAARPRTLCPFAGAVPDGLRQQLTVYHVYYNFVLPHASLRQPLEQPLPTNGTGSATLWRPRTPAMAAGLTDHVWTLREVLLFRVPPWPQPQAL
jgi:hypothetical protein